MCLCLSACLFACLAACLAACLGTCLLLHLLSCLILKRCLCLHYYCLFNASSLSGSNKDGPVIGGGIAVGVIVLLCVIIVVVCYCRKKNTQGQSLYMIRL